jgi:hypothetical protein
MIVIAAMTDQYELAASYSNSDGTYTIQTIIAYADSARRLRDLDPDLYGVGATSNGYDEVSTTSGEFEMEADMVYAMVFVKRADKNIIDTVVIAENNLVSQLK